MDQPPTENTAGGEALGEARAPSHDRPRSDFEPILSRTHPPRLCFDPVPRRVLVESLRRSREPLVLVSAPAGTGKTAVLLQWAESEQRPYVWLQLDDDDNDPVVLLAYLTLALGKVTTVDRGLPGLQASTTAPSVERALPHLDAALADAPPFLLVLDDSHHVTNDACWRIIGFLVEHLPLGACLAVGTRTDPPLPLGRLRAATAVTELRARELAFDRSEAQEVLARHGLAADVAAVESLLAATEGWAAVVSLAARVAQGRDACVWLPEVRGDQGDIADYLAAEVLGSEPEDLREFLMATSILRRLSPALCRVVTGRADAHELLARLAGQNLFVHTLDDRGEWYRHHALFGQFLRGELERREPDEKRRLHGRAAEWYANRGDIPEAVRQWLAADEVSAAAASVVRNWTRYWERGQVETVRRLLACFTREQILAEPALTLTAGWVFSAFDHDPQARFWAMRACGVQLGPQAAHEDADLSDADRELRSSQALLRAMLAPDGIAAMRRDAELAAKLEKRPGSGWHVDALEAQGRARWLSGAPAQAIGSLQVAGREGSAFNWSAGSAAMGHLSLIAADGGEWELAKAYDHQAQERLEGLGVDIGRRVLPALLARVRTLAHRGDPRMEDAMQTAAHILEQVDHFPWMTLLACVVLGESCLEAGDYAGVDLWSARGLDVLRGYPDAGILVERIQRLRFATDRLQWTEPITPAEERVLELLPTHLTLDQIADRLFLSKNTVKTHLRGLYRKLGTESRADAVARARELGLLGPQ
jgi:LuxR family maltose regulon positive regulatory protein